MTLEDLGIKQTKIYAVQKYINLCYSKLSMTR